MVSVVFGARGNVGRHVVAGLLAAGEQVRAVSRNPEGLPAGLDVVAADLERPETLPAAFAGADSVFLYGLLNAKAYDIAPVVAAAEAAGITKVALLSSVSVVNRVTEHQIPQGNIVLEQGIQRSALDWTFLRPGTFATNTRMWWAEPIRTDGVVRLAYPDAYSAPVPEKDIAAIAVAALSEDGHSRQCYTIYGSQSLTLRRQIDLIGEAIGKPIRIEQISDRETREEVGRRMPPFVANAIVQQWADADGIPAKTSVIVERITGKPAQTFAEWAVDHAEDFR